MDSTSCSSADTLERDVSNKRQHFLAAQAVSVLMEDLYFRGKLSVHMGMIIYHLLQLKNPTDNMLQQAGRYRDVPTREP